MTVFSEISTGALVDFHARQLKVWPAARGAFEALQGVKTVEMPVGETKFLIQHNPARIVSTGARVDRSAIAARPCFLCAANRPHEQLVLDAGEYEILVNPFPIFPLHFTIPAKEHVPQLITGDDCRRFVHMFELAQRLPGLALFYNGPACGASAPDHFHFQAVERRRLPLFGWLEQGISIPYRVDTALFTSADDARSWFSELSRNLSAMPENEGEPESRMNVLCSAEVMPGGVAGVRVAVIPRRAHRPSFYGSGEGKVLLSPASVDLAGVMVAPSPDDFNGKITPHLLTRLLAEVCCVKENIY